MTPAQVLSAVDLYEGLLRKWVSVHGKEFPLTPQSPLGPTTDLWRYPEHKTSPDQYDTALHLLWMFGEMRKQLSDSSTTIEKTMRWLGFAQGCLWKSGLMTIQEMKEHNT